MIPVALTLAVEVHGAPRRSYLESICLSEYDLTPQGFTVECWIRVRSTPGFNPRVIDAAGPGAGTSDVAHPSAWMLGICRLSDCAPGRLSFTVQSSGEVHELFTSGRVDDGAYHHVAGTYDGRQLRVYLDGILQQEKEVGGFVVPVAGGKLVVGDAGDQRTPFDGEIDELRIWSSSRSSSELRGAMTAELDVIPRRLVGYWPMNGNGEDRSRSKNRLVPHNYVTFPAGKLGKAADIANVDVLRGDVRARGDE